MTELEKAAYADAMWFCKLFEQRRVGRAKETPV